MGVLCTLEDVKHVGYSSWHDPLRELSFLVAKVGPAHPAAGKGSKVGGTIYST